MFTYTPCDWTEQPERPGYWTCANCQRPYGGATPRASETKPVARRKCEKPGEVAPKKSRGLGDTVAKAIHTVTGGLVKPCGGCKKRQEALNNLLPYRDTADDGRSG